MTKHYHMIFLITIILSLSGCYRYVAHELQPSPPKVARSYGSDDFYVQEIEGCEYIVYNGSQKGGIIHKHNCKFCAERALTKPKEQSTGYGIRHCKTTHVCL